MQMARLPQFYLFPSSGRLDTPSEDNSHCSERVSLPRVQLWRGLWKERPPEGALEDAPQAKP